MNFTEVNVNVEVILLKSPQFMERSYQIYKDIVNSLYIPRPI